MKHFRLIFASIIILFAILALMILPAHSAEWKHSPLKDFIGQGDHYLLELPQASCAVIAHSDGRTVFFANDADWDGIAVMQKITIDKDGKTIEEIGAIERKYPHKKRKGYRVYIVKCQPYFKDLPPEIQHRLTGL